MAYAHVCTTFVAERKSYCDDEHAIFVVIHITDSLTKMGIIKKIDNDP